MIPSTMPRPAPPAKRSSSTRTITSNSIALPAAPSSFRLPPPPPPPPLQVPGGSNHTLVHKLSSSSLCSSVPPDSPPTTFDDPPSSNVVYFASRGPSIVALPSGAAPTSAAALGAPAWSSVATAAQPVPLTTTSVDDGGSPTASIRRARGNGVLHLHHLSLLDSTGQPAQLQAPPHAHAQRPPPQQPAFDSRAAAGAAAGDAATRSLPRSSTSALAGSSYLASNTLNDSTLKTLNHPDAPAANLRREVSSANDLGTRSRAELEKMLEDAGNLIRSKEQELSIFTAAGEGLLQEYNSLRTRHDALLSGNATPSSASGSGSPTKGSMSRPGTSRTSSGTSSGAPFGWSPRQLALGAYGYPPPSVSCRTSEQASASDYPPWTAIDVENQAPNRDRSDSNTSSHFSPESLRAPSIMRSGFGSPMNPRDVQALNQQNEALTQQLTELEADSEKADREGRKRLRKLERELSELRQELCRVESVNDSLKEKTEADVLGSHVLKQSLRDRKERGDARTAENKLDATRRALRRSSFSDSENEHIQKAANFAPSSLLPPCTDEESRTGGRRHASSPPSAGSGPSSQPNDGDGKSLDVELARAKEQQQDAEEAQKAQEFIMQKLMDKIEELQETNEIITSERIEMEHRLREATVEVDEFKRRCEELEEMAALEGLEWNERRGITWREELLELQDAPADRLKGNRRAIEQQRRRQAGQWRSISGMSHSMSIRSVSLSRRSDDSPIRNRRQHASRTLGSELGSELDGAAFEDEPDHQLRDRFNDSDPGSIDHRHSYDSNNSDDEGETNGSSHDTSRPTPQRRTRHYLEQTVQYDSDGYESPIEDTSRPIFAQGSLRLSGPPDSVSYDQMNRVVSDLPAAWEDEGHGVEPPTPYMVGRVGGRLLEWVEGAGEESDDEEIWSRYPEEEEPMPMARLESREAVEARSLQRNSPNLMRRRRRGGTRQGSKRSRVVSDRLRDVFDEDDDAEEDERLTRRQIALRRMGLEEDLDFSDDGSYDDEYGSNDDQSIMTDFEMLDADRRMRHGDYYPVSLRARYAPRMLVARITDSAMQHLVTLITYVRFFALLAMAVTFALWQGPKRTLGEQPRRRRRIQ